MRQEFLCASESAFPIRMAVEVGVLSTAVCNKFAILSLCSAVLPEDIVLRELRENVILSFAQLVHVKKGRNKETYQCVQVLQ